MEEAGWGQGQEGQVEVESVDGVGRVDAGEGVERVERHIRGVKTGSGTSDNG